MTREEARRQADVMADYRDLYEQRVIPNFLAAGWTRNGAAWLLTLRYLYLAGCFEGMGT